MAELYVEADNKEEVNNEYVVEKILNKRIGENGQVYYYLKWQGWPESDSTWEPEEHCLCDNLIQEFEECQRKIQRENDASAKLSKAGDQLPNTSDSEDNFDEFKKRNRRGEKSKKSRRRIAKLIIDSDDDEDDGSDYEKSLCQSKKRRSKKGNSESGYLSTDYLNDESTTTVDSDSSSAISKKSKDSKDSVNSKVKKTRISRENEAIQQILSSGGVGSSGRRSRDRSSVNSSDNSKETMSSSPCAKESESKSITVQSYSSNREQPVVKQHRSRGDPLIKQPDIIQPIVKSSKPPKEALNQTSSEATRSAEQPIEREKLSQPNSSELIESLSLKRRVRISSSSSSNLSEESSDGDVKYEDQYFGWERGKKIIEINDWRGYKEKILHLVRYEDGEEEYVDDFYTCTRYPSLTLDMYTKTAAAVKSEEHRIWYNYAIQRFYEIEKKGSHVDELSLFPVADNQIPLDNQVKNNASEHGRQQNVTYDHSKTGTNMNVENIPATTSECQGNKEPEFETDNFNFEFAVSNDEFDDERIIDQVIEEEMGNDENNQNYQNTDSGSSSGSRSVDNTLTSELVVNSTQSESFHLHDSDFIVHSDSSFNTSISSSQSQVYPEFEVTESDQEDCPTGSSETMRPVCNGPNPGESSNSQEYKQTIHSPNPSLEIEAEFYFDSSSPPPSVSITPPIESSTIEHDFSLEAPDVNNSDYSDLNEEDVLFDPSPPSSPYHLEQE